MTQFSRRAAIGGALASMLVASACGNGVGSAGAANIDARVAATQGYLASSYPATQDLAAKAAGQLVMPLITKAGLGVGASYGRGALLVNGVTVDYYSAASASVGLQVGAQQYAHVLYFMTEEALQEFRTSPGWAAGGDIEYAINAQGANLSADTTTVLSPVVAIIFGQAGLIAGATVEGTKYTRIIP